MLLLLILLTINAAGQNYFSKTVDKKEGRFISGRIDASEYSIRKFDKAGLVKDIQLNIELWSLLGEPLEKYLFRWHRGNSVVSSDFTSLDEQMLAKYPDLQKRFLSLKPSYVELRYYVSTELKPEYTSKKDLDVCGEKFINNLSVTKEASWGSNGGASGHRDINSVPHFIIVSAGATGNDLTPTGAKDWTHFITWDGAGVTNERAHNTFRYAGKMTFYGLEVTNMEIPVREIDAIAKEYKKREDKEKEDVSKEDIGESDKEKKEVNNWDNIDKNKTENSWDQANKDVTKENEREVADKDNTRQNNWDLADKEKNKDNGWGNESAESSGWDTPAQHVEDKDRYEIRNNGDQQGVYDKVSHSMVIPYGNYTIKEYKADAKIALVTKNVSHDKETVSCIKDGSVEVYVNLTGYIDYTGNWVIEPEKSVYVMGSYLSIAWYGLTLIEGNESYEAYQRRKARDEKEKSDDKECYAAVKSRANEIAGQYRSRGLKVDVSSSFNKRH